MASGISAKALAAEKKAYQKLKRNLGNAPAFAAPAGFDAGFPDFGFEIMVGRTKVDVHVEYKADHKAQMGSMRDWIFDGRSFSSNDTKSETKSQLLAAMNADTTAIKNGKRLLTDLRKHFDKRVKSIYSGALSVETDKRLRRSKVMKFVAATDNYQIANIDSDIMGNKILTHYRSKFKKVCRPGTKYSILLMMLKDRVWLVAEKGVLPPADKKKLAALFGGDKLPRLSKLKAKLEVRIQPRGLNSPSKPVSIDVMASLRLSEAPLNGLKVIT